MVRGQCKETIITLENPVDDYLKSFCIKLNGKNLVTLVKRNKTIVSQVLVFAVAGTLTFVPGKREGGKVESVVHPRSINVPAQPSRGAGNLRTTGILRPCFRSHRISLKFTGECNDNLDRSLTDLLFPPRVPYWSGVDANSTETLPSIW